MFQQSEQPEHPTVFQTQPEGNTPQGSNSQQNKGQTADDSLSTADLEQINAFHPCVARSTPEIPNQHRESSVTAQSPHARSTPSSPTTTGLANTLQQPHPTCSDDLSVIAGSNQAHTSTQPDQSEVQTPQDFSFNSEDPTSCSHPQCNLTTAEEATELMQALEASKEEDVKRQTYEAIKARED